MTRRRCTIFPARGASGAARAARMCRAAEAHDLEVVISEEQIVNASVRACLQDAVVIFDLSPGEADPLAVYRMLPAQHAWFAHVLVVSTAYTAVNVAPPRRGGAPQYPFPMARLPNGWLVPPLAEFARSTPPPVDRRKRHLDPAVARPPAGGPVRTADRAAGDRRGMADGAVRRRGHHRRPERNDRRGGRVAAGAAAT